MLPYLTTYYNNFQISRIFKSKVFLTLNRKNESSSIQKDPRPTFPLGQGRAKADLESQII